MKMRFFPFRTHLFLLYVLIAAILKEEAQSFLTSQRQWIQKTQREPTGFHGVSMLMNRNINLNDGDERMPGTELFPGKGPYVPSGLSLEEYTKLKQNEAEDVAKMNFGAWGPRFQLTETPDGDWMVIPKLWTNGFDSNFVEPTTTADTDGSSSQGSKRKRTRRSRIMSLVNTYGAGFYISYILSSLSWASFGLYLISQQGLLFRGALSAIAQNFLFIPTQFSRAGIKALIKPSSSKILVALALSPLFSRVVEQINRKMLWSTRRTIVVTSMATTLSLVAWCIALRIMFV